MFPTCFTPAEPITMGRSEWVIHVTLANVTAQLKNRKTKEDSWLGKAILQTRAAFKCQRC